MPEQTVPDSSSRVHWPSVVVFYGLACAISWPWFWWRWAYPESWAAWKGPKHLLYMWGPGLAAIIVMLIVFRASHRPRRTISLLGTSTWRSLVFWFAPLLLLGAAYWPELSHDGGWIMIPVLATLGYLTILGEELGWRGFLQDALRPLPRLPRYVLIGVMWEVWHFTTRWSDRTPLGIALMLAFTITVVIVLSFIIGEATDRGRSLTVAVTLHAWANMMFEAGDMFHASPLRAWLVAAACVPLWAALLWTWPRTRRIEAITTPTRPAGWPGRSR